MHKIEFTLWEYREDELEKKVKKVRLTQHELTRGNNKNEFISVQATQSRLPLELSKQLTSLFSCTMELAALESSVKDTAI